MKLRLVQTCAGCPEQYDAYYGDTKIGYLRVRHGFFYCEYILTQDQNRVYGTPIDGDGNFTAEERETELNRACAALIAEHQKQSGVASENLFEIEVPSDGN